MLDISLSVKWSSNNCIFLLEIEVGAHLLNTAQFKPQNYPSEEAQKSDVLVMSPFAIVMLILSSFSGKKSEN